jgi:hypothetical protein
MKSDAGLGNAMSWFHSLEGDRPRSPVGRWGRGASLGDGAGEDVDDAAKNKI